MKFGRIAPVFIASLALLSQSYSPAGAAWFADKQSGCKAYFPYAAMADETGRWSGACRNGLAQGHGAFEVLAGGRPDFMLAGDWRGGKLNGHGVYTQWNIFEKNDPFETRFEGAYRDSARNGHGVETWADGGRFEGEFADGDANGHGVLMSADGTRHEGIWKSGCLRDGDRWLTIGVPEVMCGD